VNSWREVSRRPRICKGLFQIGHADARRGFGCSRAAPVGFEADSVVIAVFAQRAQLANPVHDAGADRLPFVFAAGLARDVLRVAMPDPVLRQQVVAIGKGVAPGKVPALPGSQLSMKFLFGMAFQQRGGLFARSGMHDISFSRRRTTLLFAQISAACLSLSLIASRYGA